ncbi:MAG: hypothetical protein AAF604_12335 [Acidobacteriota bacterium]
MSQALDDWSDLRDDQRQLLVEHGEGCSACRPRIESTVALFDRLEAAREQYRGLRYGAALRRPEAPRALSFGRSWMPLAAMLVLVALLAVPWLRQDSPPRRAEAVAPGVGVTPGTALAPVRRQLSTGRLRRPVKPSGLRLRPPRRPGAPAPSAAVPAEAKPAKPDAAPSAPAEPS